MGVVVRLHSRSSKAASSARVSALRPASLARCVASKDDHHSAGMLWRCHHLETCAAEAPISSAHNSRVGQSSTTLRNEQKRSVMPINLGQIVLDCKDKMDHDTTNFSVQNVLMAYWTEKQFIREFIRRTRSARIGPYPSKKRFSQPKLAKLLGMSQGTYKNYETNRQLPLYLLPLFCDLCGVRIDEMLAPLSGATIEPINAPEPVSKPRRGRRRKSKAA